MEKPPKPRPRPAKKMLKFLSRAATFSIPTKPYDPAHDTRLFSGPLVPAEARHRKTRSYVEAEEPTSPKVSCMGKVKHKKVVRRALSKKKDNKNKNKTPSVFTRMFGGKGKERELVMENLPVVREPNSIGHMKRFASSREAFVGFDWRVHTTDNSNNDDDGDYDDGFKIPHSAPLVMTGGHQIREDKKDVSLWKRRTIEPPRPLKLS